MYVCLHIYGRSYVGVRMGFFHVYLHQITERTKRSRDLKKIWEQAKEKIQTVKDKSTDEYCLAIKERKTREKSDSGDERLAGIRLDKERKWKKH